MISSNMEGLQWSKAVDKNGPVYAVAIVHEGISIFETTDIIQIIALCFFYASALYWRMAAWRKEEKDMFLNVSSWNAYREWILFL